MKNEIKAYLESKGIEVIDVGTNSPERLGGQVDAVSPGVDERLDDLLSVVIRQGVAQHLLPDAVLPLACEEAS